MEDVAKLNKRVDTNVSRNIDYNKYSVAIMICINKLRFLHDLTDSEQYKSKFYQMILNLRKKLNKDKRVSLTTLRKCYSCNCTPDWGAPTNSRGITNITYNIENYKIGQNIEIVDDYSGGVDKALSAERGKELFYLVTHIDSKTY